MTRRSGSPRLQSWVWATPRRDIISFR